MTKSTITSTIKTHCPSISISYVRGVDGDREPDGPLECAIYGTITNCDGCEAFECQGPSFPFACCLECDCFEEEIRNEYGNPAQCSYGSRIVHEDCPQLAEDIAKALAKELAGHHPSSPSIEDLEDCSSPDCATYRENGGTCAGCLVDPCPVIPF